MADKFGTEIDPNFHACNRDITDKEFDKLIDKLRRDALNNVPPVPPTKWEKIKKIFWRALPYVGVGAATGAACYAVGYVDGKDSVYKELQREQEEEELRQSGDYRQY